MARYILGIILALNWNSICCAQHSVEIAPDQPTGAVVRYFGWDTDDQQLIGLKKWELIKPKKRIVTASLSRVEGNTLIFKSSRGKTMSVPAKSLNPKHQQKILDALRAHGIL